MGIKNLNKLIKKYAEDCIKKSEPFRLFLQKNCH